MASGLITIIGLLIFSINYESCMSAADAQLPPIPANLPPSYSRLVRPNFGGPAVQVGITGYINAIELKDHKMNVIMYLRQTWSDPRLKNDKGVSYTYKAEDVLAHIWTPDLFFPNAVQPSQVINKGFIRVSPTGDVLYSQLTKESLSCPGAKLGFNLFILPQFDCSIDIESYGFSTNDIVVKWAGGASADLGLDDLAKSLELYKLVSYNTTEKIITLSTGNYNRLAAKISFESQLKDAPKGSILGLFERIGRK